MKLKRKTTNLWPIALLLLMALLLLVMPQAKGASLDMPDLRDQTPIPLDAAFDQDNTVTAAEAKFNIGDWVQASDRLNVRKEPSIDSDIIWTAPEESLGVVIAGPQSGSGYTWWQIRYDYALNEGLNLSLIGWSSQDWLEKCSPPAPSPKFLTSPFTDPGIQIWHGWIYHDQ